MTKSYRVSTKDKQHAYDVLTGTVQVSVEVGWVRAVLVDLLEWNVKADNLWISLVSAWRSVCMVVSQAAKMNQQQQ